MPVYTFLICALRIYVRAKEESTLRPDRIKIDSLSGRLTFRARLMFQYKRTLQYIHVPK